MVYEFHRERNDEWSLMKYKETLVELNQQPAKWLLTGVAGFIGSNLLEREENRNIPSQIQDLGIYI